jgi:serine protease Do
VFDGGIMKILLIVTAALLVITVAGGGFFISNLNGQIDKLQTKLTASIEKIDSSVTQFTADANTRLTGIEKNITENSGQLKAIDVKVQDFGEKVKNAEAIISNTVMQTPALYDRVKKSVVRITDGEQLSGSGFVMNGNPGASTSGTKKVVTAYHVIQNLSAIYVTLYDGRSWKATVWASSEAADVAILKLDAGATGLPDQATLSAVTLADSLTVQGGDPIFVIGSPGDYPNPLGLPDSITTGVVSQIHRGVIINGEYKTNLIQIDAAVNPGNSGGPLFNIKGEVIGIAIAMKDPAIGSGINYAVTSNTIKKVEKIIVDGQAGEFKYDYPLLGVSSQDLTPSDIAADGNTITTGAKVSSVNGPAQTAGIKAGDIVTRLDDHQLRDLSELSSFVQEYYAAGDTVTVTVIRNGVTMKIRVELGVRP